MYCNHLYANKPELPSRPPALRKVYNGAAAVYGAAGRKFICKDFWSELFKKQIDNLKTNHRGTFVLQDNRFRWLSRMCLDPSAEKGDASQENSDASGENKVATQILNMHLHFSCGVIRGALHNLGIACAVSAHFPTPCMFICGSYKTLMKYPPRNNVQESSGCISLQAINPLLLS